MILARYKTLVSIAAAVLATGLAACGGSSKSTSSTKSTSTTVSATKPPASGQLHATLRAENHTPTAGKAWTYTVRAQANGRPVSGTVRTQFVLGGLVVGTESPPVHALKDGRLHDVLTFPTSAVGHPIAVQAVVQTSAGSATLNWPVTVKP